MRARIGLLLLLVFGGLVGSSSTARAAAWVELAPSSAWGSAPIHVASPLNDPRLFVVERSGVVRVVKDGVAQPTPFVIVPNIDTQGERGLLSIAFPWDYATSGRFYVFAVVDDGSDTFIRVLEYRVSANPDVADGATQRTVLQQRLDGATNHNGGQLAFSPTDGLLYITIGENATPSYAQDPAEWRGKVLRIDPADPDGTGPATFSVPAGNPIVGSPVYALGLRNPYRAAFAPDGRFVIGDVGQSSIEEIDVIPAGNAGVNFGWPTCEGTCTDVRFVNPVHAYANDASTCAVIGGVVVRDATLTGLTGRYLFTDLCQRGLQTISLDGAAAPQLVGLQAPSGPWSFGEDARGCVYIAAAGTVSRLAASAGDPKACAQPYLAAPPAYKPPTQPDPNPGTGGGTGGQPSAPGGSTNPTPSQPGPIPTNPTTPKPAAPAKVVYPKNCTRDGRISIRVTGGTVKRIKLVRGKKTKTLKFKRVSGRLQLSGIPTSSKTKLRISVRVKGGRVVRVDKTYKPCKG